MYKTKDITKKELQAISIANQDEIADLTGSKLDPIKAWEVIKLASDNFNKQDEKAKEADELLYKILNTKLKKNSDQKEIIRLQEKERARALELLELELQIAA